jgi:hypothetical protein
MEIEDPFLGGLPPINVTADKCDDVTINVNFIFAGRDCDTLKRWAEQIKFLQEGVTCPKTPK